ncbi:MAG: hypothetical protein AAGJ52_10280 [Pseudomonadota bacterium]
MAQTNTIRVGFLAFDDLQALDLLGPLEAFQTANEQIVTARRYDLVVLSEDGQSVTLSSGVQIVPQQ